MRVGRVTASKERRAGRPPAPLALLHAPAAAFLHLRGLVGRHLSTRAKLTLWYGGMCGLTLALAGAGMYVYVQGRLSAEIDRNLLSTARSVNAQMAAVHSPVGPGFHPVPNPQYKVARCSHADRLIQLYCSEIRQELDVNSVGLSAPGQFEQVGLDTDPTHLRSLPQPITPTGHHPVNLAVAHSLSLLLYAYAGRITFLTVPIGSQTFRVYLTPLRTPAYYRLRGVRGLLEVFQNEGNYQNIERILGLTLLLGAPIGLLIALLAGWWIARAALRPIGRISRTVRAIGESRDFSRRLDFVGPYDEIGRLAETFDGMMERLERVFDTQKRFIADASHELRTPLTAIRGNADLLRIAPDEDREACLSSIRREAERMTRLVSDLLVLAEADVAEQKLQISSVDLDDLLIEVYQSARVIAGGKVDVVLEQTDPVCVEADADRLKQLLLNLVDNAVKFTPEGGVVSMGLWRDPQGTHISVSDSGAGIPPEEQAAIFERFYRLEASRSKRGSGLGLAICNWIAQAHDGAIEVSSEPGKGSKFTLRLPESRILHDRIGAGSTG